MRRKDIVTIKYNVVARRDPRDAAAPEKYYPLVKSTGEVALPELAKRAAEISTLSAVDLAAAVEAILFIIPRALADGDIVRLGDFGTFSLRIRSEGSETRERVSARNITRRIVNFRPGERFTRVVDEIEFVPL
jgi:predicted histone-like DNA-binding protein